MFLTNSELWKLLLVKIDYIETYVYEIMELCVMDLKAIISFLLTKISRNMDNNEVTNKKWFDIKLINIEKYTMLLFFCCSNSNYEKENKYYYHYYNYYRNKLKTNYNYSLMPDYGIIKM